MQFLLFSTAKLSETYKFVTTASEASRALLRSRYLLCRRRCYRCRLDIRLFKYGGFVLEESTGPRTDGRLLGRGSRVSVMALELARSLLVPSKLVPLCGRGNIRRARYSSHASSCVAVRLGRRFFAGSFGARLIRQAFLFFPGYRATLVAGRSRVRRHRSAALRGDEAVRAFSRRNIRRFCRVEEISPQVRRAMIGRNSSCSAIPTRRGGALEASG